MHLSDIASTSARCEQLLTQQAPETCTPILYFYATNISVQNVLLDWKITDSRSMHSYCDF
jgi:hypothetical protein